MVIGLANPGRLSAVGARVSIDAGGRVLASGYVAGVLPVPPGRLGVFEGRASAGGGAACRKARQVASNLPKKLVAFAS